MKTQTKITISTTPSLHGFHQTDAEINEDGSVCVTDIYCPNNYNDYGHTFEEKRRYFKTRANAAKKLRKDWADALAFEAEDGEMVEAGDAHWSGEPYPLKSALDKLSGKDL